MWSAVPRGIAFGVAEAGSLGIPHQGFSSGKAPAQAGALHTLARLLTRSRDPTRGRGGIAVANSAVSPRIGDVKELATLLNTMREAGVILDYALFGAAAQMRYTEPVATFDADVLVAIPTPERLDILKPLYEFCARLGWHPEGEAIRVGSWPVQFIPVFSPLTREALEQAELAEFEGVPFRVVSACHLAVIALSVGRPKDYARILALLDAKAVTRETVAEVAARHGLGERWQQFVGRFLDAT